MPISRNCGGKQSTQNNINVGGLVQMGDLSMTMATVNVELLNRCARVNYMRDSGIFDTKTWLVLKYAMHTEPAHGTRCYFVLPRLFIRNSLIAIRFQCRE